MTVRVVAIWAPVVGAGLAAWLGWGLMDQRDVWVASDFVLLFYGSLLCVAVAHVTSVWVRRRGLPPPPPMVRDLRALISGLAVLGVLWVWFTPVLEPLVGWWLRQVALWKFGW